MIRAGPEVATLLAVVPSLGLGGAERSLIKLLNSVGPRFQRVHLVCLAAMDAQLRGEISDTVPLVLHELKAGSSGNPWVWLRLWWLVWRIRPTVVLGWSTYANLVASVVRAFSPKLTLVLSERNYVPRMWGRNSGGGPLRRRIVLAGIRRLYQVADVITANSRKNTAFLKKFVGGPATFAFLPNAIEFQAIAMRRAETAAVPADWGQGPRILALGRLDPQKGFDILLRAVALLCPQRDWRIVLVGDGPEAVPLRELAQALAIEDRILWAGRALNPFPWYAWADLVVVPSRYEGFPNVPLEAMACGRAVICADCDSGPRELTENGAYGRLVPVENSVALAQAILELGDAPAARADLGRRAEAHVRATYGSDQVAAAYARILLGAD